MLAGVLDALEALPAEAAAVRRRVRVLHLVLPVRWTRAEPENKREPDEKLSDKETSIGCNN